jgi:hypothetical protein
VFPEVGTLLTTGFSDGMLLGKGKEAMFDSFKIDKELVFWFVPIWIPINIELATITNPSTAYNIIFDHFVDGGELKGI